MKTKSFSKLLIETRERLELSPQDMAFILGIHYQMYRIYERGVFDKTHGQAVKGAIIHKINTLDLELKKKILLLETTLRKWEKDSVNKNVKTIGSNGHNLKEKAAKR